MPKPSHSKVEPKFQDFQKKMNKFIWYSIIFPKRFFSLKNNFRDGKVSQWVKELVLKSDDLNSISRTGPIWSKEIVDWFP